MPASYSKARSFAARLSGATTLAVRRSWVPTLIVLVWAIVSHLELVNSYLIPSPGTVLEDALQLISAGTLQRHLAVSLGRVFVGYSLTVLGAIPLALFLHHSPRWFDRLSIPLSFLRVTPPLALIPILILWLGIGEASKVAIIVLASFFPVFVNAHDGLHRVEGRWRELSRSLELNWYEFHRFVLLPGALPQIVSGLRIGFGYAWRALIGAEIFAAASGLGYLIVDSQEMARIDRVFVGILAIGITGLTFDAILDRLTTRSFPWATAVEEQ
ncbi:MAG: ABC transporter permease [Spirochaeta sp.]|jgi:sulfonate transport system permease protein|nr:ABC transporter permease [Spirochaeta sp.]